MRKSAISGVSLVVLMCWLNTVIASPMVYTDKTLWENALGGQFQTEDFSDLVLNDGINYDSSESGHISPGEENYQDVLASFSNNEPTTIWLFDSGTFGSGIYAYGGTWTLGGPGGTGNSLLVSIGDPSEYVGYISNSYDGEFWGFISNTPFASVKLIGGSGTTQQNFKLDNMVYSQVPEPATISLMTLSAIAMIRRRRL